MVGFVKETLECQIWSLKSMSHFVGSFEGNWEWKVRGVTNENTHYKCPIFLAIVT